MASKLPTTAEAVALELQELQRLYPCSTQLITLGHSHLGRPIQAMAVGQTEEAAAPVLLDGGHHGDEPLTLGFVMDALRYVLQHKDKDPRVKKWLAELSVWFVPAVNPDGLAKRWRKNGRDNNNNGRCEPGDGVDLNRNYPFRFGSLGTEGSSHQKSLGVYRGPKAASEPETQAMMRLAKEHHFAAAISYHYGAVAWLVPYTTRGVPQARPSMALHLAKQLAARLPPHPHAQAGIGFPVRKNLYPVDGTSQDWLHARFGTMAYIVEGGLRSKARKNIPADPQLQKTLRATWQELLQRIVQGPTLQLQLIDQGGQPLFAQVHLEGQLPRAGESWTTRCKDGRTLRFVAKGGPQVLLIQGGDGRRRRHIVTVNAEGITRIRLRIRGATSIARCL
jgi:hypothetical protein